MNPGFYYPVGNEVELLKRAFHQQQPAMLTGPTGCGKTRLVDTWAKCSAVRSRPSAATTT
jgi:MoxR-like ATPase